MDAVSIDQLIQQCAAGVAPSTMAAIIKVESGGNPLAIGDNTTKSRVSPTPKTIDEAAAIALDLISKGHNLDLGLSQINSSNLKAYKVSVREIFEPCINVSVGSSILSKFYLKSVAKYGPGETSLYHALSAYNTGSFYRGPGYVAKILKAAGSNASTSMIAWKQPVANSSPLILAGGKSRSNVKANPSQSPIIAIGYAEAEDGTMKRGNEIIAISDQFY